MDSSFYYVKLAAATGTFRIYLISSSGSCQYPFFMKEGSSYLGGHCVSRATVTQQFTGRSYFTFRVARLYHKILDNPMK